MLATHPEVQERLYDEIINIFPEKDFEMEYEHLEQLPYLDMIINETLRLAPSIPLIGRHVTKDMPLTKDRSCIAEGYTGDNVNIPCSSAERHLGSECKQLRSR